MSEVQPQPGDKVIIRYRPREIHATVDRDGLYPGMDDVKDGRADVEIVEHADPSGTVRGDRYACLDPGKLYGWWDFRMSEWALAAEACKEPVTGAVPGTPAAQAQHEQTPVIQHGDEEPDTSRAYVDKFSRQWMFNQSKEWWYTVGHSGGYDWDSVTRGFVSSFPWREVGSAAPLVVQRGECAGRLCASEVEARRYLEIGR